MPHRNLAIIPNSFLGEQLDTLNHPTCVYSRAGAATKEFFAFVLCDIFIIAYQGEISAAGMAFCSSSLTGSCGKWFTFTRK